MFCAFTPRRFIVLLEKYTCFVVLKQNIVFQIIALGLQKIPCPTNKRYQIVSFYNLYFGIIFCVQFLFGGTSNKKIFFILKPLPVCSLMIEWTTNSISIYYFKILWKNPPKGTTFYDTVYLLVGFVRTWKKLCKTRKKNSKSTGLAFIKIFGQVQNFYQKNN